MERESFEDNEVADMLNTRFVPVKVDKEERPDIDAVYMQVCQALTGSGGWPMTVLMTPEQKPFFAGTYFPKNRRYGHPGLLEMLDNVSNAWHVDRQRLCESSEQITAAVTGKPAPDPVHGHKNENAHSVENADFQWRLASVEAAKQLRRTFDPQWGGFGSAPKFPMPHNLMFLLRYHRQNPDPHLLRMVEATLQCMYRGGIFDHIGGGFSRYSTDNAWLVPHFEKMLYDNALLIMAYLEGWQVTGNPLYKEVALRTLGYIRREMSHPDGGFYCAQDADIDGEEGKFYTFTTQEIEELLGKKDATLICKYFDITQTGNFEGMSIPNLLHMPDRRDERIDEMLPRLLEYRTNRLSLHKDDKVLTAWNALMIVACARAGRVLGDMQSLTAAEKAFHFIQHHLTDLKTGLCISWRSGKASGVALLDDHVFLVWAMLELYESTFEVSYLTDAIQGMDMVIERFSDPKGGFFMSPENGEQLLFRPKEQYDGAMPCGNSVAAYCLARLAALTGESRWQEAGERQLSFFAPVFARHPHACTFALLGLMQQVYPSGELVCTVPGAEAAQSLAMELGAHYHPETAILAKWPENAEQLAAEAPFTRNYKVKNGGGDAFYLCQNHTCSPPVHTVDEVLRRL